MISLSAQKKRTRQIANRVSPNIAQSLKNAVIPSLEKHGIAILPPCDVKCSVGVVKALGLDIDTTMLDPWYNKGIGGTQNDYVEFFLSVIKSAGDFSDHVYFWGFPEIVAPFVERIPPNLILTCWLTWYYKNNPSVIRGWRSSQNACLHLSKRGAKLYPERFLNAKQLELKARGKLRYMPGPTSVLEAAPMDVIEQPLLVGFVGKSEQTGHPAQKPASVYEQLLKMTMSDSGIVFDPMCGSGTAGAVAQKLNCRAILSDRSEEYISIVEKRLGIKRLPIREEIAELDSFHLME